MSGEHTCVKRNKHAVITRVGEEVDFDRMIADKDGRVTPFELSHEIRKKFESDAEYATFAAALPSEKVMSDRLKKYRRDHTSSKDVEDVLREQDNMPTGGV